MRSSVVATCMDGVGVSRAKQNKAGQECVNRYSQGTSLPYFFGKNEIHKRAKKKAQSHMQHRLASEATIQTQKNKTTNPLNLQRAIDRASELASNAIRVQRVGWRYVLLDFHLAAFCFRGAVQVRESALVQEVAERERAHAKQQESEHVAEWHCHFEPRNRPVQRHDSLPTNIHNDTHPPHRDTDKPTQTTTNHKAQSTSKA